MQETFHKKITVLVLRAVSGAGKSTLADIFNTKFGWVVVCADDYFTDADGNYNFDATKLGIAHNECQKKFMEALSDPSTEGIVVANTNTKDSDWAFYKQEAEKVGAKVVVMVIENHHGGKDIHNVPEETLQRQKQNIINSLKLR
jgi:uridine kinase